MKLLQYSLQLSINRKQAKAGGENGSSDIYFDGYNIKTKVNVWFNNSKRSGKKTSSRSFTFFYRILHPIFVSTKNA